MAFKFNPFTGTLDQTGSGGGASYIDGEVQNFSALPETLGTPAVDSAYLVREAEGTWLLARKPAGIYIRTADTGVRADDWTHASAFPDVFSDAAFTVYSDGDSTKNLQLSLSGLTTGTTRTLTAPDASGTIALTSDFASPPAIGNTTPNTAAFTTLTASSLVASGNVVSDSNLRMRSNTGQISLGAANDVQLFRGNTASVLELRSGTSPQTFRIYNTYTDASNFERLSLRWASNVAIIGTEKGSVGGSARALELQANGVTKIVIAATGNVTLRSADTSNGHIVNIDANTWRYSANGKTLNFGRDYGRAQSYFSADEFVFGTYANVSVSQTGQVVLTRDADNTLAQRNGANGQTFRLYNTFTNATNFERLNVRWASNELIIDAEAGSAGGTLRGIKLGSASTDLLGFFGATPVVQQAAVADATDAATAITQLNDLLASMRTLGLIAT
jgi:hypothetical protein